VSLTSCVRVEPRAPIHSGSIRPISRACSFPLFFPTSVCVEKEVCRRTGVGEGAVVGPQQQEVGGGKGDKEKSVDGAKGTFPPGGESSLWGRPR